MDARPSDKIRETAEAGFVTGFDAIPNFKTYLAWLNRDNLIVELLQNDLDQDAMYPTPHSAGCILQQVRKPADA